MENRGVEAFAREKFAENAGLSEEDIFSTEMTMAALVSTSPRMTNSIDLMEAFAKTSNALRKEYGVRVRLPAMPLDTPVSSVMKVFLEEFNRQRSEKGVAT
jgi:hypothetical protein